MNTRQAIETEAVKLPLWKNCLENLRKEGVTHGKTYTAEFFEKELRCDRNSMQFGLAISEIRRELEKDGFYISGRGQKGNQFVILPPESNQDVMRSYGRAALDALKRGVVLGTNTRLDTLSVQDRRRHEATLEKMAVRLMMIRRQESVCKIVSKHSPKLLEST